MRKRHKITASFALAVTLALPVAAAADGPAAYQGGPDHAGLAAGTTFAPPLGKRWVRRDLGGDASYPVIAEGKVFLAAGGNVYALDLGTGRTVWSRALASRGLAYEAGRVFAVGGGGMQALSAATGERVWAAQLSGSDAPASAPTASGGYVYASGSHTVYGVRQSDGLVMFAQGAATSDGSIPAVDSDKTYTTAGCAETSALQRTLGVEVWHYTSDCTGGGAGIPVLHGGHVYTSYNPNETVLDAGSGALVESVAGFGPPAFAGDSGYYRAAEALFARSESSGLTQWRTGTTAPIAMPPLVAGDFVYAVTGDGKVAAFARDGGAQVWQGDLGVQLDSSGGAYFEGMAAAGGMLVVPARGRVVAFGPGADTPGVDDPDKPQAGNSTLTLRANHKLAVYRQPDLLTGALTGPAANLYRPVEIEKDPWPYGSWEHAATAETSNGRFQQTVRPQRNTRYRAVFDVTAPGLRSRVITVFADVNLRLLGVFDHGRRHVLIKVSIAGPSDARLRTRRVFVYYLRKHARFATRIGVLRPKGSATKARAQHVFATPPLRRSDLFFICRTEHRDDGFGKPNTSLKACGHRRLR